MNGAVYDSTWNVFFKMHYGTVYKGMLSTALGPLDVAVGEIVNALLRGLLYASGFLVVSCLMGLTTGVAAVLALPAVMLVAFAFASVGLAVTSFLSTYQRLEWVNVAMLPMFLFSGTFFPISVYPETLQWCIRAMPLWHGVELVRGLTTGEVDVGLVAHVGYLAVMAALGVVVAWRLDVMFRR